MAQYLLPCSCGQSIPISPRQAGQEVDCPACQQTLKIPTLGAIKQLPLAEGTLAAPTAREAGSTMAKRLGFALLAVITVASLTTAGIAFYRAYSPDREGQSAQTVDDFLNESFERFDGLPPHELLILWKDYQDPGHFSKQIQPMFYRDLLRREAWKRTGIAATGIGLLCLIGAIVLARRS